MSQIIAGLYEIERKIGSGGGGIVYLGRHIRLEKRVVLKADRRKLSTDTEALRREVDLLKSLSHTYIPQVYDFVQEDGVVYTVMDYIEGESLDKLLGRGQIPSQPQVIRWACQLLEALCYLHGQPPYGILHGDIKPANIMLRPNGDICLIDFNIALALGEEGAVNVGYSRGYASPEHYGSDDTGADRTAVSPSPSALSRERLPGEAWKGLRDGSEETAKKPPGQMLQAAGEVDADETLAHNCGTDPHSVQGQSSSGNNSGKSIKPSAVSGSKSTRRQECILLDVRSDIYSLGATLYHLLSGIRPAQDAKDVKALTADVCSPAVSAILQKAMAPDPAKRYQTAAEMLDAFRLLHKRDPRTIRHRRRIVISAGILSMAFLLGGITAFIGQRQLGQIQEALAMSEYSANALAEGDVSGAVSLALQAVHEKEHVYDAPVAAQAQLALTQALGVYDLADGFQSLDILELPGAPFDLVVSPSGTRFAVTYAYETAVYNLEDMEKIAALPIQESAYSGCAFLDENRLVYAGAQGVTLYDLDRQENLWTGRPGTTLSISADGKRVAAINRREDEITIYSTEDGVETLSLNLNGKHMAMPANDIFANPRNDIFALNEDGSILAVSFSDGGLVLLDTENPEYALTVYEESEYSHYQGGFCGQYFAFAAGGDGESVFGLIDVAGESEPLFFESGNEFLLQAEERGIYLAEGNLLVNVEPAPGTDEGVVQKELARTDNVNITAFSIGEKYVLAAADDGSFSFYDGGANVSSREESEGNRDFVAMAGDYAIVGSRNEPALRLMRLESHPEAQLLAYDARYGHSEARVSGDGRTVMLFDYEGFRIYDMAGNLVAEERLPDAAEIYDQQFIKDGASYTEDGNFESGNSIEGNGSQGGNASPEGSGSQGGNASPEGNASQGGNGSPEGNTSRGGSTSQGGNGSQEGSASWLEVIWYDGTRRHYSAADGSLLLEEKREAPDKDLLEEFTTKKYRIVSGLHTAPEVYDLKSGRFLGTLEQDSYLTYVTQVGEYILTEYISTSDERYGILLDDKLQKLAILPGLCDVAGDTLVFDYGSGDLRYSRIYSLEELMEMGEEVLRKGGDCISYFPPIPNLDKPGPKVCHFAQDFIVKCLKKMPERQ